MEIPYYAAYVQLSPWLLYSWLHTAGGRMDRGEGEGMHAKIGTQGGHYYSD